MTHEECVEKNDKILRRLYRTMTDLIDAYGELSDDVKSYGSSHYVGYDDYFADNMSSMQQCFDGLQCDLNEIEFEEEFDNDDDEEDE